jgi:hypothetical protein
MNIRSSSPLRRSSLAALVVACAAMGLAAFTASASANFTLSSGLLELVNGTTTGTPPEGGSWVSLPEDAAEATGFGTFLNGATTAANQEYTLIDGEGSGAGLELGKYQATGGIFGPLTDFGETAPGLPFEAITVEKEGTETYASPSLTFEGTATGGSTRNLVGGTLAALSIVYNSSDYYVGAAFGLTGGNFIESLTGTITGNPNISGNAKITLLWRTHIAQSPFNPWDAHFHFVATYKNP